MQEKKGMFKSYEKRKYFYGFFVVVLVISMTIAGVGTAFADDAPSIAAAANISYIDDGNSAHLINIYGDLTSGELYPVVLRIHGGGSFGGTQANNVHIYEEQENPLKHVFNVSEINWSESIQANEESVSYLKSLLR